MRIIFVKIVILLVSFFLPLIGEARVYLDITAPDFRKIPVAVPFFVDQANPQQILATGKEMADTLSRALDFHSFVSVLDPMSYGGGQETEWKSLGVDFAVLGNFILADKKLSFEGKLIDVNERRMIMGRQYSGPWERRNQMLLKFCDEIILTITGEQGVSLTKIAFVSDATRSKEVYVADVLGDQIRQVTRHQSITTSPRFSPDAKRLAYTSYHRNNANLYVTDLSQDKFANMLSNRSGLNIAPAWSPDGQTMVATLSKDGNPDLYILALDGRIVRKLTAEAGINVSPTWSPDGRQLAFVSDRSGNPQIYVMDMETAKVQRITYSGNYNTSPSWSPKGDWIAYSTQVGSGHQIFLIKPEGGSPIQITSAAGSHESPSWSPDGRMIVFTRNIGGKTQLYTMLANGMWMKPLFHIGGNQAYPHWSNRLEP